LSFFAHQINELNTCNNSGYYWLAITAVQLLSMLLCLPVYAFGLPTLGNLLLILVPRL